MGTLPSELKAFAPQFTVKRVETVLARVKKVASEHPRLLHPGDNAKRKGGKPAALSAVVFVVRLNR